MYYKLIYYDFISKFRFEFSYAFSYARKSNTQTYGKNNKIFTLGRQ